MSVRAYIKLFLKDGRTVRYVRDVVQNGDSGIYYQYGDTAGDTWGGGDTPGTAKFDFETLKNNAIHGFNSGDSYIKWPESGGDTYILVRDNYNVPKGDRGDSEYWNPKIRTVIASDAVTEILLIEERLDDWYST